MSTDDGNPCLPHYEIRVSGRLGSRWAAWFDGLDLTTEEDGTTVLLGPVVDQAALHGLLQKLRDIGVPLLSLTRIPCPDPTGHHPSGATS
jgi:hypothetical protein